MENLIFFVQYMLYFRTFYKATRVQYLRLIVEKNCKISSLYYQYGDFVMGILLSFWVDEVCLSEVMKLQS